MRRRRKVLLGLALAAAVGAGVLFGGFLPIAASDGHWAVTNWLLHFTMRRTVKGQVLGLTAPPLDDPALVLRGAGHFEMGCRPCHGAPGSRPPQTLRHMTPMPPWLVEHARDWTPEELFWIVKHGIKFTGMPGWPDLARDDEVWAMVAFLRRLPRLDEAAYNELAFGPTPAAPTAEAAYELSPLDPDTPPAVGANCARCHGRDGQGRGLGAFPRLAGQRERYLFNALAAYARGERKSGTMRAISAALDEDDFRALARYYARRPGAPASTPAGPAAVARGAQIAREGLPGQRVPPCFDCHGPTDRPRNAAYPRLAGQYEAYLLLQLQLFRAGARGGSEYEHLMAPVAKGLREDQMKDVAAYFASLDAEGGARP